MTLTTPTAGSGIDELDQDVDRFSTSRSESFLQPLQSRFVPHSLLSGLRYAQCDDQSAASTNPTQITWPRISATAIPCSRAYRACASSSVSSAPTYTTCKDFFGAMLVAELIDGPLHGETIQVTGSTTRRRRRRSTTLAVTRLHCQYVPYCARRAGRLQGRRACRTYRWPMSKHDEATGKRLWVARDPARRMVVERDESAVT